MLFLAIYVLNLGYGFEKPFRPLRDFQFISISLAANNSVAEGGSGGNRFRESIFGAIPVPLPANYLLGIDEQVSDFERGKWSYLNGVWKPRGWWYFYLYGFLLKEPIGCWVLLILALSVTCVSRAYAHSKHTGCRQCPDGIQPLPSVCTSLSSISVHSDVEGCAINQASAQLRSLDRCGCVDMVCGQ
jgi:hypothetical protein